MSVTREKADRKLETKGMRECEKKRRRRRNRKISHLTAEIGHVGDLIKRGSSSASVDSFYIVTGVL